MEKIVLFDGECHFCHRSVQFIIKRDSNRAFKFASLQSEIGKKFLNKYGAPNSMNSFVLIEDDRCYTKSSAALRVCKQLKGVWKLLYFFIIIPKVMRDPFYKMIAKNRHKILKEKNDCILPPLEERKRFL